MAKKKKSIFPASAKIGDTVKIMRTIKGQKRELTFKKVKPFGKNKRLDKVIIRNRPVK